jgi:hypothetical protein
MTPVILATEFALDAGTATRVWFSGDRQVRVV